MHSFQKPASEFGREPNWTTIEIPGVVVDGDFFVCFYTNSRREGGVYVHVDSSIVNQHSEYVTPSGEVAPWPFVPAKETANWMIRVAGASATVTSSPLQTEETSAEFQKVVSSLDNPGKLSDWMINNLKYESHYEKYKETGINYIASPEETFSNKTGCCAEFAVFACYVLKYHGYDAKILRIAVESNPRKNHVVCVYSSSGSLYTINVGRIEGPFQTYKDIAFKHDQDWSEYNIDYSWEKFQQLGRPDEIVRREG